MAVDDGGQCWPSLLGMAMDGRVRLELETPLLKIADVDGGCVLLAREVRRS
jgi:hypothetical protein